MRKVEDYIRSIPDFPEPGIIFRDITTVMQDPDGLESRGFMFGTPIAYNMGKPFVPIRKKGKLPCETISEEYSLEYGTAEIEIHTDAIKKGQKVVIVDDLIATGGTVEAAIKLIERLGGEVVACVFLTELVDLKGRDVLEGYRVESIVKFDGK